MRTDRKAKSREFMVKPTFKSQKDKAEAEIKTKKKQKQRCKR